MDEFNPRFTMTEDHLKLLRAMYVGWQDCEYGAPEIDPKRPYGNSSGHHDVARVLGVKPDCIDRYGEEHFSKESAERLDAIHRETQNALQIVLATGTMTPGHYERAHRYDFRSWRFVGPL